MNHACCDHLWLSLPWQPSLITVSPDMVQVETGFCTNKAFVKMHILQVSKVCVSCCCLGQEAGLLTHGYRSICNSLLIGTCISQSCKKMGILQKYIKSLREAFPRKSIFWWNCKGGFRNTYVLRNGVKLNKDFIKALQGVGHRFMKLFKNNIFFQTFF